MSPTSYLAAPPRRTNLQSCRAGDNLVSKHPHVTKGAPGCWNSPMVDHFPAVAEERRRIADFLDGLSDEQWNTASCCSEWTVAHVAAHLLVGPLKGITGSLPATIQARGNLDKANTIGAEAIIDEVGRDGLSAKLREVANHRFKVPFLGSEGVLIDVTLHGQDMARPLGIDLAVPAERWLPSLEAATHPKYAIVSARKHLKGLAFEATDLSFSAGDGPAVTGSAKDLAHAMWGRADAVSALEGKGVDALRERLR